VTSCDECGAEWDLYTGTEECADPRCGKYSRGFSEYVIRLIFKRRAILFAKGERLSHLELPGPWRFEGHPTPESIKVSAPTTDVYVDEEIFVCF